MRRSSILILIILLFSSSAFADSPLTSTIFYEPYRDLAMVNYALEVKVVDAKLAAFFMAKDQPIGYKAAAASALGWNFDGQDNASRFRTFLEENKRISGGKNPYKKLTADELIILGYLTALDDYFNPKKAEEFVDLAAKKAPKSYTVMVIRSLVKAQIAFDVEWCLVWKAYEEVDSRDDLEMDLEAESVEIIRKYMILYKDSCK